jgi:ubiquinone/menaquinone biosynthesis C-methylase UbiE
MSDLATDRTAETRYVFETSDTELERLIRMARFHEPHAAEACARTGIGPGGSAIEFGCGPLGGLLALSDAVGPLGTVVGVDRSAEALATARGVLDSAGREHVCLVQADLNAVTSADLCPPGPFDMAFAHFVLMYQTDPVASLRRMASVVRPGGHVVVQDLIDAQLVVPSPYSSAADVFVNRWFFPLLLKMGGTPDLTQRLSAICQDAGLEEVSIRPFAPTVPASRGGEAAGIYHDALLGARTALLAHAITDEREIDSVLEELRAAERAEYACTSLVHIQLELVARVP